MMLVGSIGAYMTDMDSASNVMSIGNNTIEIVENFQPPEGGYKGGEVIPKEVKVTNIESVPCYVRVYLESTYNERDIVYINNTVDDYLQHIPFDVVFSDWFVGVDGWYYYSKPLDVGESTTNLIDSVKYLYDNDWYYLRDIDIYVYSESIQDLKASSEINRNDFITEEEFNVACTKLNWEKYNRNKPKEVLPLESAN